MNIDENLWQDQWYPVAYLRDLHKAKPCRFVLLGEALVIWFDKHYKVWRAFIDKCPHRLASLSEGRLNANGELECPYHGWSFNGMGICTKVPQISGELTISSRANCKAYATAEAQGMLFVFSGDSSIASTKQLPVVNILDQAGWFLQDTFRDLPYDSQTLLENVLDVSHVPFTHHATVGKRSNAGPVELEILTEGPEGFSGIWNEGPRQGRLGTQHTTFMAPALMWHDLTAKGFARILTVVYATPTLPGKCRLFARFPFQFEKPITAKLLALRPIWLQHIGNNLVLEDDQIFLHHQERNLEASGGSGLLLKSCFLPTSADKYIIAFHNWISKYGGYPFPGKSLPPLIKRHELLDRLNSHTRSCASCSAALRRFELVQKIVPWLILLLLITTIYSTGFYPRLFLIFAMLITLSIKQLTNGWLVQLRQGDGMPPRNQGN